MKQKMSEAQKEKIAQLETNLLHLEKEYKALVREYNSKTRRNIAPAIPHYPPVSFWKKIFKKIKDEKSGNILPAKPKHAADMALDIWPIRDWFRLSYSPWNPGKYTQICIGPLRMEFFAS